LVSLFGGSPKTKDMQNKNETAIIISMVIDKSVSSKPTLEAITENPGLN